MASGDAIAAYGRRFEELKPSLPGAGIGWLEALRGRAIERLTENGFPTRKIEAFKFTDLTRLNRTAFDPALPPTNGLAKEALAPYLLEDGPAHLLVFVDGRHRPELSDLGALPQGVSVASLAEVLAAAPHWLEAALAAPPPSDGEALLAFNTAFMRDGAVLRLAPGVRLETPLHLLFVTSPAGAERAMALRNLILAEEGSSATVLESYAGEGAGRYLTSAVTQVVVGEGAALRHAKLQDEGSDAIHLAATSAALATGSSYASFALSLGGRLARNDIAALLDGSGIDCDLSGAYLGRGRQHLDTTTWIDHAKPGSTSREHYMGVLDESAHGVFQGKITVRPDAQASDAHQLNKNLLLSDRAQVDTKPELEIHADDVKCSHGATAGELDADSLFYLRARGLDEELARRLLIEAFIADVVDHVEATAVREHLKRAVLGWLRRDRN